jgi:hypothetical protein
MILQPKLLHAYRFYAWSSTPQTLTDVAEKIMLMIPGCRLEAEAVFGDESVRTTNDPKALVVSIHPDEKIQRLSLDVRRPDGGLLGTGSP